MKNKLKLISGFAVGVIVTLCFFMACRSRLESALFAEDSISLKLKCSGESKPSEFWNVTIEGGKFIVENAKSKFTGNYVEEQSITFNSKNTDLSMTSIWYAFGYRVNTKTLVVRNLLEAKQDKAMLWHYENYNCENAP